MSQIIASTYEIVQQIGSGGGGVVYLARHLRLGKWVVLKADKRTLSTQPEVLRREVDALKNLSHTYIPQVYDFIVEDGVVYTVMDYIEGESLDKPLKRGERYTQAQVIEWACQLLEALCYLHSRPPHGILHSDIKPANIMLTPQGHICLIDFNIALALGEEGAVRVGFSRGYASPEHYGVDFTAVSQTQNVEDPKTKLTSSSPETILQNQAVSGDGSSSASGKRTVLLDVRSDIYSLGATLYHLLTGNRPAQDAHEVLPIPRDVVSPAVADIIEKAMDPNPDLRYQSAEAMLYAFEHLHENDPRTKRHKRRTAVTAALLAVTFLLGGFAAFTGLKQMERTQNAYALAEYSSNALQSGDVRGAISYALEALPENRNLFDPPYIARAQRALANALGVYDVTDGFKSHRTTSLSSEPLKVAISPEGTYVAAVTQGTVNVFDTDSGALLAELAAEPSALSDVVFAEEDVLIYAGDGALRAYAISEKKELWSGEAATAISLSADGSTVATVYKDETFAVVYDAKNGKTLKTVDFQGKRQSITANDGFADPEDNLFSLSGDGHWLAVSFSDGSLRVFDLWNGEHDMEIYDASAYTHFEGGFFHNYFAFVSTGVNHSVFAVIDMERMEQIGGFAGTMPFHTQTDESGIYVAEENTIVRLDPETGEQTEVAYTDSEITAFAIGKTYTLIAVENGAFSFFDGAANLLETHETAKRCDFLALAGDFAVTASRDVPSLRLLKLENHADAQLFTYDIFYAHDEARLSANDQTVMLFRYDAFRIYSIGGELLAEVSIPDAEQVYDQQYRRAGNDSYLEVIYYDGLIRCYSALDGAMRSETIGEKPDETLYEEFFTDRWRITSPLHGTPEVYDRESGEFLWTLESDAYLTYVTQTGDYVVTEYVTAQGDRYGLLLDERGEILADLPNLCDILPDGTLVFDDMRGNLRASRIYSIQELLTLAQQTIGRD